MTDDVEPPPDVKSLPAEAVLFRKIAEVMAEVGRVEKRGRNDFHKYDYVTEADLVEEVRSKLSARNVALIPSVVSVDGREYTTEKGKNSVVTTVVMAFTFVDGETGAMFRSEWAGQGDDPADKGLYKAYTGALKYFLMKTFLIPTGDDPEADKRTDERSAQRANGSPSKSYGHPGQSVPNVDIPASEAQVKLIKSLATKAKATVPQLNVMLATVGVEGTAEAGWTSRLTGGRDGTASTLISWFKESPLPDPNHEPDISADTSGFETAPLDAEGQALLPETLP